MYFYHHHLSVLFTCIVCAREITWFNKLVNASLLNQQLHRMHATDLGQHVHIDNLAPLVAVGCCPFLSSAPRGKPISFENELEHPET